MQLVLSTRLIQNGNPGKYKQETSMEAVLVIHCYSLEYAQPWHLSDVQKIIQEFRNQHVLNSMLRIWQLIVPHSTSGYL